MTTTTPGAIRDIIIARIAGLTPPLHSRDRFVAHREEVAIRDWAAKSPAAALRRFTVETAGDTSDPTVTAVTIEQVSESFDIVIAYPSTARFADRLGLNDVIASDLRHVTYHAGTAGFSITPTSNATIVSGAFRREVDFPGVVFGVIPLTVTYWRSAP